MFPTLTIAIPTYNRNDILRENLPLLLSQLTPACKLLIVDNCSDICVTDTLNTLLAGISEMNVEIVRNRANIGGAANIMRCVELCETEWLWVLSDDDKVKPNAIATVFQSITLNPNCIFFNFSRQLDGYYLREQLFITRGFEEFVERFDYFSELVFISSCIWSAKAVQPQLKFGYRFAYSMYPNLALLLTSLGEDGICCFSNECIVDFEPAPVGELWSPLLSYLGFATLFELPLGPQVRRKLAAKYRPSLEYLLVHLILVALKSNDYQTPLYFYDQIIARLLYFEPSVLRKSKSLVYGIMLRFPQLSYQFIAPIYKIIRHESIDPAMIPDQFARL